MNDSTRFTRIRSHLSRRQLLAGAAALAAPAVIGSEVRAQASKVVVGTWGGDYARLLRENIDVPILQKQGIEVVQDVGDVAPRVAKVQAQRRLPRGSVDVVCLEAVNAYLLSAQGLLEPLDEKKVPNLAHLDPKLRAADYAAHIYSPQILIYNPDRVPNPPTTFGDLLDPKYKGKVGFPDVNYFYVLLGAALYGSGNPDDMEKAKEVLLKLNDNGLKLYPTTDSAGPPYKSGELDVGVMWMARVVMWQNAGIPVKGSFQKEGSILYVSGMGVPKNAPNKEGAYKYINAMLEPSAQQGFAAQMGYLPTVNNAPLSGKVAEQLALPNPAPKLIVPDYAFTTKVQPEMADWWKKNIQHG
jgi:putative spermidine/putrescine transport system substrate-binding protein